MTEWKAFLERYGFVVIDNILSDAETSDCEAAFWTEMRQKGNGKLSKDDYKTWDDENWPLRSKFLSEKGFYFILFFYFMTNLKHSALSHAAFDVRYAARA